MRCCSPVEATPTSLVILHAIIVQICLQRFYANVSLTFSRTYPSVWRHFQEAAGRAGIARFGTHSLRHSYRSWLDALGTGLAVQQKLMRHADIRTTMNVYGDVVTPQESEALAKISALTIGK